MVEGGDKRGDSMVWLQLIFISRQRNGGLASCTEYGLWLGIDHSYRL